MHFYIGLPAFPILQQLHTYQGLRDPIFRSSYRDKQLFSGLNKLKLESVMQSSFVMTVSFYFIRLTAKYLH